MGEIAVEAERDFAQQEIADGIDPVLVDQHVRLDHVLQALAHLLAFHRPPAVGEYLLGRGSPAAMRNVGQ